MSSLNQSFESPEPFESSESLESNFRVNFFTLSSFRSETDSLILAILFTMNRWKKFVFSKRNSPPRVLLLLECALSFSLNATADIKDLRSPPGKSKYPIGGPRRSTLRTAGVRRMRSFPSGLLQLLARHRWGVHSVGWKRNSVNEGAAEAKRFILGMVCPAGDGGSDWGWGLRLGIRAEHLLIRSCFQGRIRDPLRRGRLWIRRFRKPVCGCPHFPR